MYWLAPPFSIHCLGAHVLSIEGLSAAAAGSNNVLQEGLGPGQGGDGLGDHVPDVQLVDHVQTQYQGRSFNTIHNNQSPFISLCRLWMNNIFYNMQRGFLKLYFSMNADKIADLERKIRKGPLPSTVNTINWLFSNQEFSIKPKQYHLSILTTRPRPCPPVATDCLEMTSWRTWWRWRRGWTPAGRTRGCSGASWRTQARTTLR